MSRASEEQMEERTLCLGENADNFLSLVQALGAQSTLRKCGEESPLLPPGLTPPAADQVPLAPVRVEVKRQPEVAP